MEVLEFGGQDCMIVKVGGSEYDAGYGEKMKFVHKGADVRQR